ncbi:TRAP transporter large permease subunit [Tateyamaria pelophila]|uniref:TRAP transporter large permease subunit n=1 Tax=Tateyamaria pelophila TaxID=328415 RepID=UPI001CBD87DD|nr:TRAP transporter large permease subunit [Tateyamaria pelophila]
MFIRVEALKVSILMSAMISFFGFDPLLFWTLFLRNLMLGAVTPLFGYALFAFGASSPAEARLRDIYGASWSFIGLIIVTLVLDWIFPGFATCLPSRLWAAQARKVIRQRFLAQLENVVRTYPREVTQAESEARHVSCWMRLGAFNQEGLMGRGFEPRQKIGVEAIESGRRKIILAPDMVVERGRPDAQLLCKVK